MKSFLLFCLLALAAAVGVAYAQPPAPVMEKPLMLVAAPAMQGPYRHTALIVFSGGERHLGFIVNRSTGVKLATLFPDHAPAAEVSDPVHFGGPAMADSIFAIARRDPGPGAVALFEGVYFAGTAQAIDRVIDEAPHEARFFAGFVAWEPGELEQEIDAGYWYVTDPDPALFFRADTRRLWEELVERLGSTHARRPAHGCDLLAGRCTAA